MKSTRQSKSTREVTSRSLVRLDPAAWLAAHDRNVERGDSDAAIGDEMLARYSGSLPAALEAEKSLRAEIVMAYLLSNPKLSAGARQAINEVCELIAQVDRGPGQHH